MGAFRRTVPLDRLRYDPQHILVTNNDRRLDYPDVLRMNVDTGTTSVVLRNPGDVLAWVTDWEGVVRMAAFSDRDSGATGIRLRGSAEDEWIELARFGDDEPSWTPVGFSREGTSIFVSSNLDRDLAALYEYDLEERKITRQIFSHERVDVSGLIMSARHRMPIGIVVDADRPEVTWWSEEKRDIQELVDRTFPETFNFPVSMSEDETRMVISSSSERQPSKFHLLDFRGGSVRLVPLGESRPWIRAEELSPTSIYWIAARDERPLQVFLTVPNGRVPGERVPLLVLPHGGTVGPGLLGV